MSHDPQYRFDHVHVYCSDLPATEGWFVEKMGAELIRRRDPKPAPASDLRLGGAVLYLREQWPNETLGEGGASRFGTDHFGLAVDDLNATAAELKRREWSSRLSPMSSALGCALPSSRARTRCGSIYFRRASSRSRYHLVLSDE